jgi:hypothetical protein
MRRETIKHLGFYNPEAIDAEDYDLWARAAFVTQVSNLQDILLEYRVWSGGISSHNALSRDQTVLRIRQLMINKLMNCQVEAESIITPYGVANSSILEMVSKVCKVASLMPKLYFAYLNSNDLSPKQVLELACLVLVFFKNTLKEIIRVKCDALQNRPVG